MTPMSTPNERLPCAIGLGVDDASRGGPAYLRLTARAFHDTAGDSGVYPPEPPPERPRRHR
jgi:hypothetical protein